MFVFYLALNSSKKLNDQLADTPQTAEDIVSSSLYSGALSDIFDIMVTMRDVDTKEGI